MTGATDPASRAMSGAITPDALLVHRLGHRRLSRRTIEAFPGEQLFGFPAGGMRSYGAPAPELSGMGAPFVRGVVTGEQEPFAVRDASTRDRALKLWDERTARITALWASIPPERFGETITAFGQYMDTVTTLLFYIIDNAVHHRGQGHVDLPAPGIEPPPFRERDWTRSGSRPAGPRRDVTFRVARDPSHRYDSWHIRSWFSSLPPSLSRRLQHVHRPTPSTY